MARILLVYQLDSRSGFLDGAFLLARVLWEQTMILDCSSALRDRIHLIRHRKWGCLLGRMYLYKLRIERKSTTYEALLLPLAAEQTWEPMCYLMKTTNIWDGSLMLDLILKYLLLLAISIR